MIGQDWLAPTQAGRRLDLSAERVRQLTATGKLAYVMTPLGCLVDPADVERLAAEQGRRC
jgi:hypothetical protein